MYFYTVCSTLTGGLVKYYFCVCIFIYSFCIAVFFIPAIWFMALIDVIVQNMKLFNVGYLQR